jgi:hypothetical protein
MRGPVIALLLAALVPSSAFAQASAQASIAGVVRDTSGAVLPGVTVQAASPALIEQKSAVGSQTPEAGVGSALPRLRGSSRRP